MCMCVWTILSMVKPYKIDDSVICDNLIPIETRGKSKPIILNNPTVLVTPNQFNQNNMANETATTNAISGKMTFFFSHFPHTVHSSFRSSMLVSKGGIRMIFSDFWQKSVRYISDHSRRSSDSLLLAKISSERNTFYESSPAFLYYLRAQFFYQIFFNFLKLNKTHSKPI